MTGLLTALQRQELTALARRGTVQHRIARRANALVLLDKGMSCAEVAEVLLIDDDTVRTWFKTYVAEGLAGLERFDSGGSACDMSDEQIGDFVAWVDRTNPKSTKVAGAWLRRTFGLHYSRAGLIALMNRIGLAFRKPITVPRTIDPQAQRAFIAGYENLLNGLEPDQVVLFSDAVHPVHQARAVGCWAKRGAPAVAVATNSGRDRMNIHGAIDLTTGQTIIVEAEKIDETSTIKLFERIERRFPAMSRIFVYVDQAAYHKSKMVQKWLQQPGRRLRLRLVPVYCPHLNPIERLWGEMHRNVTHNRCYATQRAFCNAVIEFLTKTVPKNFHQFRDRISDNFRVIEAANFRVLT